MVMYGFNKRQTSVNGAEPGCTGGRYFVTWVSIKQAFTSANEREKMAMT